MDGIGKRFTLKQKTGLNSPSKKGLQNGPRGKSASKCVPFPSKRFSGIQEQMLLPRKKCDKPIRPRATTGTPVKPYYPGGPLDTPLSLVRARELLTPCFVIARRNAAPFNGFLLCTSHMKADNLPDLATMLPGSSGPAGAIVWSFP